MEHPQEFNAEMNPAVLETTMPGELLPGIAV